MRGSRGEGGIRRGGEREDLWFPRGNRSNAVDYARGGKGEGKGGDKINRHSLSLVESSLALINIDFPLTVLNASSKRTPLLSSLCCHSVDKKSVFFHRRASVSFFRAILRKNEKCHVTIIDALVRYIAISMTVIHYDVRFPRINFLQRGERCAHK